jgi:glutathionyl-hydroquinone reductase
MKQKLTRVSQQMRHSTVGCFKVSINTQTNCSRTQEAYEKAVNPLFESLNRVEALLQKSSGPYVLGTKLTEVDVRLYPTIVRFDIVYVSVRLLSSARRVTH